MRDLKVIHGNSGLFVAMPSKKRKDGTFKDTAHPLNNETREMIETEVLTKYRDELGKTEWAAGGGDDQAIDDRLEKTRARRDAESGAGEGSDAPE